ncbi:DUF3048 domain-containing protein [Candidatus Parcubacteria bacterium]|nr:DUF3048 domain-containing protein [Patescibacteria group bacterium]MCG2694337.1 DUF3048 domain-containing protein [Candidatus Parcubacteria bacterium]
MKNKIDIKLAVSFCLFCLIALTAVSLVLWQGLRPFFVSEKISIILSEKPKACALYRLLDGVCLGDGETEKYPIAVMIDNKYEARPWSGLSFAGLVYEAPVEGGITRFLAVFSTDRTIDKIGPVRSVRPYFIDWAMDIGAMLFHVGGSPEALGIINGDADIKQFDLDQYFGGVYYWRSEDRIAPHNVYTSSERLDKARVAKLSEEPTVDFASWQFKEDVYESERGEDGATIKIEFSNSSTYDADWTYDRNKNIYIRQDGELAAQDLDGSLIIAKNIAVLEADILIIDSMSRRKITTIGSGYALIFQDGKKIEAVWEKDDRWNRLRFYDKNGDEIRFNRGTTWVEVMSDLEKVVGSM